MQGLNKLRHHVSPGYQMMYVWNGQEVWVAGEIEKRLQILVGKLEGTRLKKTMT